FLVGSLYIVRILNAVGHIRTFAALAAVASAGTLMLMVIIDPVAWIIIRFVVGFCFVGLFSTVEGWINAGVENAVRGRILSIYRIVDICAVTGAQFMLPLFGNEGFILFAVMSIMITLSLVPVSLADRSSPKPPENVGFSLREVWVLSPLACIGCVSVGATNAAFRLIGPLYAEGIGLDITNVAAFMSAGIIGGAVLQYPLGYLSDRYDRRTILLIVTFGAIAAGMYLTLAAGASPIANYVGIFMFGAFALPLYSLSAAHANDHAGPGGHALVAAGLMFFFGLGAAVGPYLASVIMEAFGVAALFSYTSAVHLALALATLWRMRIRGGVPVGERSRFAMLLRTSPIFGRMTGVDGAENGSTDAPSSVKRDNR
ncbi:MAG: MFS transporter, partial [Pseudomonadota bacterium]